MKNLNRYVFLLLFFSINYTLCAQSAFDKMTNAKMGKILYRVAETVEGDSGRWQVDYADRVLYVITDEKANRMRVMTPVIEEEKIDQEEMRKLLEANFDRALDAKYSLYQGFVWSVFTHPLNELTVEQFKDAMKQVANLADQYGGTYSSTDLIFGGAQESADN